MNEADELLEVFDDAGKPTGVAKTRAEIHAAGDWHLAFFCWIVRPDGTIVLQRRSALKQTFPNRFDASAAGHVRFGERPGEAVREVYEELGLIISEEDLVPLGRHRQVHHHESGIVDREHHDVYLVLDETPLYHYRPNEEVSGLSAIPPRELVDLVAGRRTTIETTLTTGRFRDFHNPPKTSPLTLRKEDFVPYDVTYHERIATAAEALLTSLNTRNRNEARRS